MPPDRELRERLVSQLKAHGVLRDPRVARAMLDVPRHQFLPDVPVTEAYEDRAIAIKEANGTVLSSVSQPGMIAQMLQLLDVRPSMRVLEIGTGSGYNAALLAALSGAGGEVLTIDIDPELTERATRGFARTGTTGVRATTADGHNRTGKKFDRIVVTARANDIEPAWWDELLDGGRIVVPLDVGFAGERVVGFVRQGERLHSIGSYACAFIVLRGEHAERTGDVFFRDASYRYGTVQSTREPIDVIAVRRSDAEASMLERSDAVIARPTTIFGVTFTSKAH